MAFEYNDAAMAEKLLEESHEQAFFESALNFKTLSFNFSNFKKIKFEILKR